MKFDGHELKKIREARGLSQEEFGQQMGVTRMQVGKWEKGAACPRVDQVGKMGAILCISPKIFILELKEIKQ